MVAPEALAATVEEAEDSLARWGQSQLPLRLLGATWRGPRGFSHGVGRWRWPRSKAKRMRETLVPGCS